MFKTLSKFEEKDKRDKKCNLGKGSKKGSKTWSEKTWKYYGDGQRTGR